MNFLSLPEDETPNEMTPAQARDFIAKNREALLANAENMARQYERHVAGREQAERTVTNKAKVL